MPKPKMTRKSVSFQHLNESAAMVNESKTIPESPPSTAHIKSPKFYSKVLAIPFQNLLILYALFKLGLTENTYGVLGSGLVLLVLLNVPSYLNIKRSKKVNTNVPLLIGGGIFISLLLSVPLFVVIILFGAPLASHLKETFLLAVHLSVLIFLPILISYKFEFEPFSEIFQQDKIYRLLFSNQILSSSLLAIVGAWLGVIPIPLDWDRPWQQWPITLLCGGYLGSFVGSIIPLASEVLCNKAKPVKEE